MLRADFHIHSRYSFDCATTFEQIISSCQRRGINCIAVADHAVADGAIKLREIAPFKVIVAEEALTPLGEIMGMFLKRTIPSPLSVEETLNEIKAQGGLVCIPHPFDKLRGAALGDSGLREVLPHIDVIEAFNSRSILPGTSARALKFAREHNIPATAGSDAHIPEEIGNAYVEMPDFTDERDFLQSLSRGKIIGYRSNPAVHLASMWSKLTKHKPRG